jgi:hypothetical protein
MGLPDDFQVQLNSSEEQNSITRAHSECFTRHFTPSHPQADASSHPHTILIDRIRPSRLLRSHSPNSSRTQSHFEGDHSAVLLLYLVF